MSTLKQIEANRRNAVKSTGPRTEAGKAASRLNALKSGIDAQSHILPGESPEDFQLLTSEYYQQHHPVTPEQRALVDVLISSEWLLRRLRRVEHQLWEQAFASVARDKYADQTRPFASGYTHGADIFQRLQRRIDSTWRHYQQALRTLRQLQAEPEMEAAPAQEPLSAEPVTSEIGFVPINPDRHVSQRFDPPRESPPEDSLPPSERKPAA